MKLSRKEYLAKWYQENKERIENNISAESVRPKLTEVEKKDRSRVRGKKYRNSLKGRETRRKYLAKSEVKERIKERSQKKYAENKESLVAYAREYREVNADGLNAKARDKNKTAESIAYRKAYYLKRKAEGYYQTKNTKKKS